MKQFSESPDLKDELVGTISENQDAHTKIVDFMFSEKPSVELVIDAFAKAFHATVLARSAAGSGRSSHAEAR